MEHAKPPNDKAEDKEPDIKKSREYRRFKALLKKVIKAPPLSRRKVPIDSDISIQQDST